MTGERLATDGKRPCGHCGEEDDKVRVWEDEEDYEDDQPPDYIGCYTCGSMFDLRKD